MAGSLCGFAEDLRRLHGSAQRTAINGGDLFRLQAFGEEPRLLAPFVGQFDPYRAGKTVFGCQLSRAVANQKKPCRHWGVFQPPTSLTSRSACGGPQVPGSYSYIGLGPWITGSTIAQAASTTSWRAKSVGVAGHRVAEQPLVGVRGGPRAGCSHDRELHGLAGHAFARALGARAERDRDLRAQAEAHVVAHRGAASAKTTCGGCLNSTITSVVVTGRRLPART